MIVVRPVRCQRIQRPPGTRSSFRECVPDLFSRPDGWDSWTDEQKAAYNGALRAELARLRGRGWEKLARPKQLDPAHPRHSLPDENGYRCGCAAGDADWRTWVLLAGRGLTHRKDMGRGQLGPVPGNGPAEHILGYRRADHR